MTQRTDVYVLQQELRPDQIPTYGRPTAIPESAIIPVPFHKKDYLKLRRVKRQQLITGAEQETIPFGTGSFWDTTDSTTPFTHKLHPSLVKAYDLREGDLLTLREHNGQVAIEAINYGPVSNRFDQYLGTLAFLTPSYPTKPLPLELYDSLSLRMVMLLAALGLGQTCWIPASGALGKTGLILEMAKSVLHLQQLRQDVFMMVSYVGDRPEDFSRYKKIIEMAPDKARVRAYQAPITGPPHQQVEVLEMGTNTARLMCMLGYHVVWFVESISKMVWSHTGSGMAPAGGGMLSGGLYRKSLDEVINNILGIKGDYSGYGYGSITLIGSVIAGQDKQSEAVVDRELRDNVTTSVIVLDKVIPEWPPVHPDRRTTYTRQVENFEFRTPLQIDAQADVRYMLDGEMSSGDRTDPYMQWLMLKGHALKYPTPAYHDQVRQAFTSF